MISLDVVSEEKNWSKKIKQKEIFFQLICKSFPKKYQFINKKILLTLLLSNNKGTKILNKKFRKKNKVTDILSFPLQKKIRLKNKSYLGDIIINLSKTINIHNSIKEKLDELWIHGLVHLLGGRHKGKGEYLNMQKFENKILNSINK